MAKKLRLQAEYGWLPLYSPDDDEYCYPDEFSISDDLISDIQRWNQDFNVLGNPSDGGVIGFRTAQEEQVFDQRGIYLARRLQSELGSEYEVHYRNQPVRETAVLAND